MNPALQIFAVCIVAFAIVFFVVVWFFYVPMWSQDQETEEDVWQTAIDLGMTGHDRALDSAA